MNILPDCSIVRSEQEHAEAEKLTLRMRKRMGKIFLIMMLIILEFAM